MGYWIVVVDDDPLCLKNARMLLDTQEMRVSCLRSGNDLLKFLTSNEPDLILLDVMMPDMDGFETFSAVRAYEEKCGKHETPVIFLTGESNSEIERRGLGEGASDFIHKPFDRDVLIKRITNTIESTKKIENLTEEATLDKLTGFLNKASGTMRISDMCRMKSGALLLFDLDNFKLVNDLFGHDMGDKVLVAFAAVLRHSVRSGDVISRIGGDEFMAFLPNLFDEEAVADITRRINSQLLSEADALMGEDHGIPLGVSIGAAFIPRHAHDYRTLFQFADTAMYKAKLGGKHDYSIYEQAEVLVDNSENLGQEIDRVSRIMEERGDRKGAMILGKEAFSWNYRFVTRFIDRYDAVAMRILFSLVNTDGTLPENDTIDAFAEVLRKKLRRSDIIFRNSSNHFFSLLPLLSEENCYKVTDRIMNAWTAEGHDPDIKITFASSVIKKTSEQ
jgi:diguanylate cyclase (GGDEF)-like protein